MKPSRYLAEPWIESSSNGRTFEQTVEFNWCAWALVYGNTPSTLECKLERDYSLILTGLPAGFINMVSWSDFSRATMSARVEEVTASVRKRLGQNAHMCQWGILSSQPHRSELRAALHHAGWDYGYEEVGMTLQIPQELHFREHAGFELRQVRTAEQVAEWLVPFLEAFCIPSACRPYLQNAFSLTVETENPAFRHFLLYENNTPVTSGSIQFRYGVAVIYNITTVSGARNRGAASTMVRFLQSEARRAGYPSVSLFASEAGKPVYEKLGFTTNGTSVQLYQLRH